MRKNVIILTSGLTGSSVLTGLISQADYWMGDRTHKKPEYETYENQELIDLNLRLFQDAGYTGNYLMEFSREAITRITAFEYKGDNDPYRSFVNKCNQHRPWLWKDPRLWVTIRFWQKFLDLQDCSFILLTRSLLQSWVSGTLKRQIKSYRHSKSYETAIQASILDFLQENKLSYLHVRYEDLILDPAHTIEKLNAHLNTGLAVADLEKVYRRRLYTNPRSSTIDHVKALLIYLKNYSQRVDAPVAWK